MSTNNQRNLIELSNSNDNSNDNSTITQVMQENNDSKINMISNNTQELVNEYKSQCNFDEIEIISSDIKPETFYKDYISKRIPVKFNNLLQDIDFNKDIFELDKLRSIAGESTVRVEYRETTLLILDIFFNNFLIKLSTFNFVNKIILFIK